MIQATLDAQTQDRLGGLEEDGITIFTLGGGRVRGELLHGSRMLAQMAANHRLGGLETLLLGRAYLCAGLVGATIKEGDSLVLRVDGNGPAEGFSVEALPDGSVRGHLFKSPIDFESGKGKTAEPDNLFGSGMLSVTRFNQDKPHPFVGRVELKTGNLAEDLAHYYLESEQTSTAFRLGIEFDRDHAMAPPLGAGALFLQALPGADYAFLERVEASLPCLPRLGQHFAQKGGRQDYLDQYLHDLFPEILGEKPVSFACGCSRERFGSFLRSGGRDFLKELATEGPWPIETVCHKCGSTYIFEREEIEAMLKALGGSAKA